MEDRRNKIITLFEYRRLPELIRMGGNELDVSFYEDLIDLQDKIYDLDAVLESEWKIDYVALGKTWEVIRAKLLELGVKDSELDDYCHQLKTYEIHEAGIRDGKLPHEFDMEYFYFFKSCDVKMMRRLIYDRYPSLHQFIALEEWRLFDLITEINDDVEDFYEDQHTINGNGYLLSKLVLGQEKTEANFRNFVDEINKALEDKPMEGGLNAYKMALDQIEPTLALLEKSIGDQTKDARIAAYII